MVYLSPKELSALLIARKTLKDISGGTLGKEISSILNKIKNILTKHNMKEDAIDDTFSFQMVEYSPTATRWKSSSQKPSERFDQS